MEQNLPPLPQVIFENGLYYKLRGEQCYPCLLPPEPDTTEDKLLETIIAFGRPNALVRGKHSPKTISIERKNRYEKPTDQNIAPFE